MIGADKMLIDIPPAKLSLDKKMIHSFWWIGCSLLMWRHGASKQLYVMLWLVLPVTLFMSSAQILTLTGFYMVLKLFVVDFIFMRFPRLRQKYDTTAQIWMELPTDADLDAIRRRTEQVSTVLSSWSIFKESKTHCLIQATLPETENLTRISNSIPEYSKNYNPLYVTNLA